MDSPLSQVVEYHPNDLILCQAAPTKWHRHVKTMDDHMVEGTVKAATRWGPMMEHIRVQVGHEPCGPTSQRYAPEPTCAGSPG